MTHFYFKETHPGIVSLYHVVTDKELEYVVNHQYKLFPVRFFQKQYFCPTLNKEYAQRMASERANWAPNITQVHILRFLMRSKSLQPYMNGAIETNTRAYVVVPYAKLVEFNRAIVGFIERLETLQLHQPTNQLA